MKPWIVVSIFIIYCVCFVLIIRETSKMYHGDWDNQQKMCFWLCVTILAAGGLIGDAIKSASRRIADRIEKPLSRWDLQQAISQGITNADNKVKKEP